MNTSILHGGQFAVGLVIGLGVTVVLVLLTDFLSLGVADDKTLLGAIIGGVIAGLASLLATIVSNYYQLRSVVLSENEKMEASAFSCFVKINEIRDAITKNYRHYFDSDPTLSVFLSSSKRLPKPLMSLVFRLKFSDAEKVLPLKLKDAELLNKISDAEALVESLEFLKTNYEEKFISWQRKIIAEQEVSLDGRQISGIVEINKFELLELEDLRNHLQSFLLRAYPDIRETHDYMINILKTKFQRTLNFEETYTPSQAENVFR